MIVMKFGGSSVSSAAAIKRVASIVQSQIHRQPVVVVSAFGDTTDQLAAILKHAAAGQAYLAWKLIKELREAHFCIAEDLLGTRELEAIDRYLRQTFRDLQVRMSEACEGERYITAEERASTLSLGEQLSSLIVCAAFRQLGMTTSYVDARDLILTNNQFPDATPLYWESYARIRRSIPALARTSIVVLGGFVGATEGGQTTTLGRGGSDLTATIVGAAVNADEIEIWKDVDGILTADPRLKAEALLVKSLGYEEAAALAKAGAQVLHPETIEPAERLRIPITLRNTFNPEEKGTQIKFRWPRGVSESVVCKSIVCKPGVTVLEISCADSGLSIGEFSEAMEKSISSHKRNVALLGASASALFIALNGPVSDSALPMRMKAFTQTHIRSGQTLITLVGAGIAAHEQRTNRVRNLLQGTGALVLPPGSCSSTLRITMPEQAGTGCLNKLHDAFFASPDASMFAAPSRRATPGRDSCMGAKSKDRAARTRQALTLAGTRLAVHY